MGLNDSAMFVNKYINNWIIDQLFINEAIKEIKLDDDIKKKVEDYKNSLLSYEYEAKLVKDRLDTNVSIEEMREYYDKNKGNFELKDNIVKIKYFKINKSKIGLINEKSVKDWFVSADDRKINELKIFCKNNAVNYFLNDSVWLFFNDIIKEIPIVTYNQEDYLKNNKYIVFDDDKYRYYLYIYDFMIKESISPFEFEVNKIKNIILNKRRNELLRQYKEELYNKAKLSKIIEYKYLESQKK